MAKAIMIQGTMSNAGKSFLAAGLCRIFKQDGYKVAPFKSQNMALNSFITEEGLEMGRAQVMQAEACGIKPSVFMNPILLKPTSDMGSQVIVNGEVRGNMDASEYFAYKKELIPDIQRAYDILNDRYDIIVIEGAGSPAEINLKKEDIVNMGMARLAKAPVLLVGDIDRGGVFAQLFGTIMLLEDTEREMVKGLLINKFRGDEKLLEPGLIMLEEKCKIPIRGVIPYMKVDIDDEDSLSDKLSKRKVTSLIDIGIISLPHISNFTDFNSLGTIAGISVRYIRTIKEFGNPDMVILPGTKSTMDDLKWLRKSGLEAEILRGAEKGMLILGICGGYQMLGKSIEDMVGAEGIGTIKGIGLLPVKTIFTGEKTRTRVQGTVKELSGEYQALSGALVEGYEIHMGISEKIAECGSVIKISEEGKESVFKEEGSYVGNVCGTYLHGFFDTMSVRDAFTKLLYTRKGLESKMPEKSTSYEAYKEQQYEKMAEVLREHIDIRQIYEILEKGV